MNFMLFKKDMLLLKRQPALILITLFTAFLFLFFGRMKSFSHYGTVGITNGTEHFCGMVKKELNEKPPGYRIKNVNENEIESAILKNEVSAVMIMNDSGCVIHLNSKTQDTEYLSSKLKSSYYKYMKESLPLGEVNIVTHGTSPGDNYIFIMMFVILCISSPLNIAIFSVGREFDDGTVFLLLKSRLTGPEIAINKFMFVFSASLIPLFIMIVFFYVMDVRAVSNLSTTIVLILVIFTFSSLAVFIASLFADSEYKPLITLVMFIISISFVIQTPSLTQEMQNVFSGIPWLNSLPVLYKALLPGPVPVLSLLFYIPFYIFIVYISGNTLIRHSRR